MRSAFCTFWYLIQIFSNTLSFYLKPALLPFVLIFIPSFLTNIRNDTVQKIIGLLLLTVYSLLTLCLWPVIYRVYRKKQIA